MNKIDLSTESFKAKLDAFTIGCDSLENIELWDKELYGELDVYCLNELLSVVLRLIASDHTINEKEVEYVNKNFGFSYTVDSLRDVYENCQNEISGSFEKRILEDKAMLESMNVKLAEAFKDLVGLICEIIAESDGLISEVEQEEMDGITKALKISN